MIEIGCPPTLISHHCTNSLPPLYATLPHHSYATPLRRFSVSHAYFLATALSPSSPLSRAPARNARHHSHVPFLSPAAASSVALLSHLSISTSRSSSYASPSYAPRSHSRSAVMNALSILVHNDFWQCSRMAPSTSFPFSTPSYAAAHHQERGPAGEHLPPPEAQGPEERARIVDAICARGGEMMMWFKNWAVQRCLESARGPEECCKIVACMRSRIVDLATNCYGYYVLQKALDCEEEEFCLLIVSELLRGDPATTLVNKHVSHLWSKITELSWITPAPLIFAYPSRTSRAPACHESGWLVVQHAFENLEESAKDGIVDELLGQVGAENRRQIALDHLLTDLLKFAMNEQGSKSVVKVLKEGGKEMLERVTRPSRTACCAMIVDLALSLTASHLASVLPTARLLSIHLLSFHGMIPAHADKDRRAALYDCIWVHIVTLRGSKTGSKAIWRLYVHPIQFLLYPLSCVFFSSDRMRAYCGLQTYIRLHDRFKL
ncbi:hypothetical protein B0H13DRAFT_2346152 [Mycena leptocephala]|nr:hypothetical protein B0H13DRAFT_2346152 [Mycena leptocephala]